MGHMSGDILCIGSVLWDVIGRTQRQMREGSDVAGEITRLPGGVALNIAMTCVRFGLRPVLLSAVGRDRSGEELLERCAEMGLETSHIYRAPDLATDRYMAIEGPGGVIAAIADARTLEHSGAAILSPLLDGALGSPEAPFSGIAALDGNLTLGLLEEIAQGNMLAYTDMRIAPASPGKADRLMPFVNAGRGVLYVNCEEAGIICGTSFATAAEAAQALIGVDDDQLLYLVPEQLLAGLVERGARRRGHQRLGGHHVRDRRVDRGLEAAVTAGQDPDHASLAVDDPSP